jgi:p38 MAP kinase
MPLTLAIDLLEQMLVFDPQGRIDCVNSLEHRYMAEYHDLANEPVGEKFDWGFSDAAFPVEAWKVAINSEIVGASASACL